MCAALNLLQEKWTLHIIRALLEGPKGFNELSQAIGGLNLAQSLGDNGTRDRVAAILEDEEAHVDWLETQRELLDQMGLSNYLQYLAGGLD